MFTACFPIFLFTHPSISISILYLWKHTYLLENHCCSILASDWRVRIVELRGHDALRGHQGRKNLDNNVGIQMGHLEQYTCSKTVPTPRCVLYIFENMERKKRLPHQKSVILVRRDIITCTLNHSNYSVIVNWYSLFHIYPSPMITVDNSSLTQYIHICKLEGRGVYLYQNYRNRLCKGIVKNYYNIFLQRIGHVL